MASPPLVQLEPDPEPEIELFLRGETEWSPTGRHARRTDLHLTAVGEQ